MKFPDCTVVSINLPNELLEIIDTRATRRIQNRSACVRELVTEALKDVERLKSPLPICDQPN
jgi:metal-responsive CopG/Arc/MetJ family transcriptional regulator